MLFNVLTCVFWPSEHTVSLENTVKHGAESSDAEETSCLLWKNWAKLVCEKRERCG